MLLPPIQSESRSSLYFGRWHYVIRVKVPEVWLLRTLDDTSIHQRIRRREAYLKTMGQGPFWDDGSLDYVFQTAAELRALEGEFMHRNLSW